MSKSANQKSPTKRSKKRPTKSPTKSPMKFQKTFEEFVASLGKPALFSEEIFELCDVEWQDDAEERAAFLLTQSLDEGGWQERAVFLDALRSGMLKAYTSTLIIVLVASCKTRRTKAALGALLPLLALYAPPGSVQYAARNILFRNYKADIAALPWIASDADAGTRCRVRDELDAAIAETHAERGVGPLIVFKPPRSSVSPTRVGQEVFSWRLGSVHENAYNIQRANVALSWEDDDEVDEDEFEDVFPSWEKGYCLVDVEFNRVCVPGWGDFERVVGGLQVCTTPGQRGWKYGSNQMAGFNDLVQINRTRRFCHVVAHVWLVDSAGGVYDQLDDDVVNLIFDVKQATREAPDPAAAFCRALLGAHRLTSDQQRRALDISASLIRNEGKLFGATPADLALVGIRYVPASDFARDAVLEFGRCAYPDHLAVIQIVAARINQRISHNQVIQQLLAYTRSIRARPFDNLSRYLPRDLPHGLPPSDSPSDSPQRLGIDNLDSGVTQRDLMELGINVSTVRAATRQERVQLVKAAYHKLARQHHPDKKKSSTSGDDSEGFKRVGNAKTRLIGGSR
jgi:hypothetical protein